jgi:hypothetical protein
LLCWSVPASLFFAASVALRRLLRDRRVRGVSSLG